MALPDFEVGQGDGEPIWQETLADADGNPIPLAGRTVVLRRRLRSTDPAVVHVDDPVDTSADPDHGVVEWTPPAIATPGDYDAEWIVDPGLSSQITIPSEKGRYLWLSVKAAL